MTNEELQKKIDKLVKQQESLQKKSFDAGHKLRALELGQDRFRRRCASSLGTRAFCCTIDILVETCVLCACNVMQNFLSGTGCCLIVVECSWKVWNPVN